MNNRAFVNNTPPGGGPFPGPTPYAGNFPTPYAGSVDPFHGYGGPPAPGGFGGGPGGGGGLGSLLGGGGPGGAGGIGKLLGGLGNIRQVIDRMGGIDGVLENVSKAQKIMSSLQQMGPMLKLLMGKSTSADDSDDYVPRRRRRRRRRRTSSSQTRRRKNGRGKRSRYNF